MANPIHVGKQIRNINRYRQIASVLVKHGFYDLVSRNETFVSLGLKKRFLKNRPEDYHPGNKWERIRMVLEELGPAYIKLGQFLSNRPDIIPLELTKELEKLLDSVPPFPKEHLHKIVEKDLGKPVKDIFKDFKEKPFSSASIAQVHKARLKTGEKVAVKVQRPDIQHMIDSDLDIMIQLAGLLATFFEDASAINPQRIISDFKKEISKELDFVRERTNILRFRSKCKDKKNMLIPDVYSDYCSRHILTMEFIEGTSLNNIDFSRQNIDKEFLLRNFTEIVFSQIFEYGYFHADPHSGNILINRESQICFVDFGLIGILSPNERVQLINMITAVVKKQSKVLTRAILKICIVDESSSISEMEDEVFKLVDYYSYLPLKEIKLGNFFNDVFNVITRHRIRIPLDIYLLTKAMTTLEGTVRKIDPDFNPLLHVEPLVRKRIIQDKSPLNFFSNFYNSLCDYGVMLSELPDEIRLLIRHFKLSKLQIQFEHKGLEPMLQTHNQISNRISFAIITAAMMIGSSLILHSNMPPKLFDIPIIGLLAFLFSMIMSLFLIWAIIRHGRL
jgi:ubiquinone biosynthesis protein